MVWIGVCSDPDEHREPASIRDRYDARLNVGMQFFQSKTDGRFDGLVVAPECAPVVASATPPELIAPVRRWRRAQLKRNAEEITPS